MAYIKKLVMHGFKSFAQKTEIVFDKGINVIVGPNGSGKCITGDSLIQLADGGVQRISDLVNSRLTEAVRTEDGFISGSDGTEIMCLDFDTLKVVKKPIKAFVKRTSPEKILRIRTGSGREIKATKYHPLFILKNGKIVPAKAEELCEGTKIAVPRKINLNPEDNYFAEILDEINIEDNIYTPYREEYSLILKSLKKELKWKDLAREIKIPYYTIKGLLDKQSINLGYLIKILRAAELSSREIIDLIDELISNGRRTKIKLKNSSEFCRFFGYLLAEGRLAESSQIWFTNGDEEIVKDYVSLVKLLFGKNPLVREYKPNCWDVIIFSEPLKKILNKLGMASKTNDKLISNCILKHSTDDEIGNLLSGLYLGDGYVSESQIEITTKSDKLAKGIETCLVRLGILPRERRVIKSIKSLGFVGEYKSISVYGVENIKRFNNQIKLVHREKDRRINNQLNKKVNPNVDLIEVNDIVRNAVQGLNINIKKTKIEYPILDSYCYTSTIPSRHGLSILLERVLVGNSENIQKLSVLAGSDIFWDEIIEMEEIAGEEWVYDLTVEDNHNFIANNIFVHNSNVSDALCFVLGRRGSKSMRVSEAKNFIFLGSKYVKPGHEASVELVFDNFDGAFSIDKSEIVLRRVVKRNGTSVYQINGETKTQGELVEMLFQAGIDPHGFNLVLQGKIQEVVKMHPEERRKIIEDVAGIGVYENRKEKSLRELEKTEERLKEIGVVLKTNYAYLRNLEKEKAQAEKFKELELTVKRCKASLLSRKIEDKKKEIEKIVESINEKEKQKAKLKERAEKIQKEIEEFGEKTQHINKVIQQATGVEQDTLRNSITLLKTEVEGVRVRREGYLHRREGIDKRIKELEKSIPDLEKELEGLRLESPIMAKKAEELRKKKLELSKIEEERKKVLNFKSELNAQREKIKDREQRLSRVLAESESTIKQMEEISGKLNYSDEKSCIKEVENLKVLRDERKKKLEDLRNEEMQNERALGIAEAEIKRAEEIKLKVNDLDVCPLCQSKITEEHKEHVFSDSKEKIDGSKKIIDFSKERLHFIKKEKENLIEELQLIEGKIVSGEIEQNKHRSLKDRQESLKKFVSEEKLLREEINAVEERCRNLELKTVDLSALEIQYDAKMSEIEEISSRTKEDANTSILYKSRDLDQTKNIIKESKKDFQELESNIDDLSLQFEKKSKLLFEKEQQEKELSERFKKMYDERDSFQLRIQEKSISFNEIQASIRAEEDQTNYLKVGQARMDAEREAIEMEMSEFSEVELIKAPIQVIEERLQRSQQGIAEIGSINLRALEVYQDVKKEYDVVQEKVNTLEKEKLDILAVIEEIDKKKTREFMKTFKAMNELFALNFSKLSSKGQAFLEIENEEDIFAGGVNIVIRLAKGKYFDVTSLSGGEQTLVALSLLFAIQEHKPYPFYVFDEIDAALDKRNSEKLAALLNQYMKAGQYVVITHNDALIMNSNILYGVSMHDGVSKILSLKVS
jgi:chromosome segregation protein